MNPSGIIVLDGPDGTGKTTFAQELVKKYNARYIHLTYRWKNNMFEYNTAAVDYAARLAEQGHLVVIDRLWMSNNVYDIAFRGGIKSPLLGRYVDRLLLKYSGVYVICLPESSREYLDHYDELKTLRDEMYETMYGVWQEYRKIWARIEKQQWPHAFKYDMFVDGLDLPYYAEQIVSKLQEQRADAWQLGLSTSCKGFSGSLAHGSIMIIDEEPTLRKGQVWYPRHIPTKGSDHLATVLELAEIPEYQLMWTSVDQEHVWKPLLSKYEIKPITLGIKAYQHIVRDSTCYHYYGQPDNHITPEQDLSLGGNTTFIQRMFHQLSRHIGALND